MLRSGMASRSQGYVYVLEVKDIVLPVCKIGMTERTPEERCAEINKSSTGDFLWEVSRSFFVNDCRGFEAFIHSRFAPLRMKRREFFNLSPAAAVTAIESILDQNAEFARLPDPAPPVESYTTQPQKQRAGSHQFRTVDSEYADLMHAFSNVLGVKGRPFGQLNSSGFGVSDGAIGVQWNLAVAPDIDVVFLGVNLEGTAATGAWRIVDLLLRRPSIEELKKSIDAPESIRFTLSRDAWQAASRLGIREQFIGGHEHTLAEIDDATWFAMIDEALSCLDPDRGFRARRRQKVTLVSSERVVEREVSPHLTISTELDRSDDNDAVIRRSLQRMMPVYEWVTAASRGSADQ